MEHFFIASEMSEANRLYRESEPKIAIYALQRTLSSIESAPRSSLYNQERRVIWDNGLLNARIGRMYQKTTDDKINTVFALVIEAETLFNAPQDVEWTFRENRIHALQSRPITARKTDKPEDQRSWYLSLRRSFDNLKALRFKIENELIPAMILEASQLADKDLSQLADHELVHEISERNETHKKWIDSYWSDFIPFAHGMRLFGQIYNDVVRPTDPYEFMDLLGSDTMVSIERNRMLQEMASIIQRDERSCRSIAQR